MTWAKKLNLYSWIMFVLLVSHMNTTPEKPVHKKQVPYRIAHLKKQIPPRII